MSEDETDDGDRILDPETLLRKALALLIDVEAYFDRRTDQASYSAEELDLKVRTSDILTAAAHARIAGNI